MLRRPPTGDLDDATLVSQGRSSGGLWSILAAADGPVPTALLNRPGAPDAVFLDVGVGVGGICVALCRAFPQLRCVGGLDMLPRALRLADSELTAVGVRHRLELREQDVQDLSDSEAFDVAWLPLPLLPEDVARTAISGVTRALRTDGWLVVTANRLDPNPNPLQEALSGYASSRRVDVEHRATKLEPGSTPPVLSTSKRSLCRMKHA